MATVLLVRLPVVDAIVVEVDVNRNVVGVALVEVDARVKVVVAVALVVAVVLADALPPLETERALLVPEPHISFLQELEVRIR